METETRDEFKKQLKNFLNADLDGLFLVDDIIRGLREVAAEIQQEATPIVTHSN